MHWVLNSELKKREVFICKSCQWPNLKVSHFFSHWETRKRIFDLKTFQNHSEIPWNFIRREMRRGDIKRRKILRRFEKGYRLIQTIKSPLFMFAPVNMRNEKSEQIFKSHNRNFTEMTVSASKLIREKPRSICHFTSFKECGVTTRIVHTGTKWFHKSDNRVLLDWSLVRRKQRQLDFPFTFTTPRHKRNNH